LKHIKNLKKIDYMLLSIITINYNNAEGLRKTLASVASQTYPHIEHIIVDGGSTDGSVEIIREYADKQAKGERLEAKGTENSSADPNASTPYTLHPTPTESSTPYTLHHTPPTHIVRWISEPDRGIYNAMNKGLEIALGKRVVNDDHTSSPLASDYIQILNSGDILAAPDVTERMMAALAAQCAEIKGNEEVKGNENGEADTLASSLSPFASRLENCPAIFYGNMIKVNAAGKVVGKSGYTEYSLRQFYSSTLNHDCAYIRRDLFEEYGLYDENLKIVSDWKWYLQAIGLGRVKPEYVDIDVTIFDDGGISETQLDRRAAERRQVLEELLPPAVLWDYDTHAFEMEQMNRLRRWKLYPIVYFMERTLFKLEKWGVLRRGRTMYDV
jgi:glycosyltransferase involved in cell wall biosynthesis